MSKRISLNGSDWRWRDAHMPGSRDDRGWRTGSVPGCPHHDLWKLGEIPDPCVERNSLLCEWIPQRTWLYKKTFTVPEEIKGRRVQLHFEGVDYQAEFFLNGESLGTHTGMFTPAVFEVSDRIHYGGENLLAVVIEPAPQELNGLHTLEMACRMAITARSAGLEPRSLPASTVTDFLANSGYRPRREWGA